ncbi:MazG nucleotide pyrophosphohydrolase domain-containing protein [Thermogladius sp. 4427co]|uniref:MazG nucleotide pyrophosphohydrolase domain-containing protein n=1 Tax=Thermogladius sp. 4427co TaxID=3450718 RepID=UPI003F79961D
MEIKEAQELIKKSFYERDHARGVFATFTWFVEEVGELARAVLSMDSRNLREEIADVLAWLLSIANLLNIDVEEVFVEKYARAKGT